ncbi:MAG: hypothetical protein OHK0031_17310 [Anaerolineales bacterium]
MKTKTQPTQPRDSRLETPRPFLKKNQDTIFPIVGKVVPFEICSLQRACEFCSRACRLLWALSLAFALTLMTVSPALAQRGTPNSMEFGMGARLEPGAPLMLESLQLAAQMPLDWVAIPFRWAQDWPQAAHWNAAGAFAQAMQQAERLNLNILISISDAPAWAQTEQGPSPALTAALVTDLTAMYPHALAFELFPGANTLAGWGAAPNPSAYAFLLQTVQARLGSASPVYLVAGGLVSAAGPQDFSAADFTRGLYQAGARPAIISLQLTGLAETISAESLQPLEAVRAVMLENHHNAGLLWVTRFSLPLSLHNAAPQRQAAWIKDVFDLWRAQLYFGAAFYTALNPSGEVSLLMANGQPHLAAALLGNVTPDVKGLPKSG